MSDIEVNADNTEEAAEGIRLAISRALEEIGLAAEGYAQALTPVDTGTLRNSITHYVDDDEKAAYIGTNVEYAAYVELGTSRQKAQPYLVPAVDNNADVYRAILENELKG